MKYAHLEENTNRFLGWYSTDIHDKIPQGCLEIEDDEWSKIIDTTYNWYNEKTKTFEYKDFRTDEEIIKENVFRKKYYLTNTDYKMTIDYFATLTKEEQEELTKLRAEAREYIRMHDINS